MENNSTPFVTWGALTEAEPRLADLYQRAYLDGRQKRGSKAVAWAGYYRAEIARLVGFYSDNRTHPLLGSSSAYAVATSVVGDALHFGHKAEVICKAD